MTRNELAKTLHRLDSWMTYDIYARAQCLGWIDRMLHANVQSGRDVAAAIVNYDWMRDGARAKYDSDPRYAGKRDAMFAAFRQWQEQGAR